MSAEAAAAAHAAAVSAEHMSALVAELRERLETTRTEAKAQVSSAHSQLASLRDEIIELKKSLAVAQSEANFNAERVATANKVADSAKAEAAREMQRILDLQVRLLRVCACVLSSCVLPLLFPCAFFPLTMHSINSFQPNPRQPPP